MVQNKDSYLQNLIKSWLTSFLGINCILFKFEFLCWRYQTHKNNRKRAWSWVHTSNTMGFILYLAPVSAAQIIHSDCDLKAMSTFHSSLWTNKHDDPRFFSQVFTKNSLIKNIFEEEKSLIVEHYFGGENSFVFGVFGSKRGLQANHGTVRKSAISPLQAIKNELNEAILLIWMKEALCSR